MMNLKTLSQLEYSVGGRPKTANTKVRMSFYLTQYEADKLRYVSDNEARPISQQVRHLVQQYLAQQ